MTTLDQDIPPADAENDAYIAGDSLRITLTVTDAAGDPVALSGVDAVFTIAEDFGTTPLIQKFSDDEDGGGITVTDPANGTLVVLLDPPDTANMNGTFVHETRLVDRDQQVSTVADGHITITDSVADFPTWDKSPNR